MLGKTMRIMFKKKKICIYICMYILHEVGTCSEIIQREVQFSLRNRVSNSTGFCIIIAICCVHAFTFLFNFLLRSELCHSTAFGLRD